MPLRSTRLLPAAALLLAACGPSQPPAGPAPTGGGATAPAISAADLRTRLFILADDSMQGREAGTPGNVKATDYIAREVRRLGLQPAGEDGGYFQTVPLVRQQVDPSSTVSLAGEQLELWRDFAPVRPLGSLSMATRARLDGLPVVYGGRLGQDSLLAPEQAAGKLVVLDAQRDREGNRRFSIAGAVINRYAGAAALVLANLDVASAQALGFLRGGDAALPNEPSATGPLVLLVSGAIAQRVFGGSLEAIVPGAAGSSSFTGSVGFSQVPVEAPARNVIAVLPGRDPALRGQYMVIGAHNDHEGMAPAQEHDSLRAYNTVMRPWGASTRGVGRPTEQQWQAINALRDSLRTLRPPRMDSVMNGADDDGSGSVALLEVAEALATRRDRPRRSILFIWHTAEEKGLLGSSWFTDHPTVPRDSLVGMLNMDMVGRGTPAVPGTEAPVLQIIGSRRLSTELGDLIETVNRRPGHGFAFDYSFDANGHEQNRYCRSDHYMYARYGIPISYFSAGYHQDYHQLTDEPQYIHYDHLARVARLLADVVYAAADLDHRLVVDHPKPDPNAPCRQ